MELFLLIRCSFWIARIELAVITRTEPGTLVLGGVERIVGIV